MINGKRFRGWRALRAFLATAVVVAVGWVLYANYQTAVRKAAAADVEGVLVRHGGDRDSASPIVVRREQGSTYVMLGVPSADRQFHRDWIILNATPGGSVVKIPRDGRFDLRCDYLQDLRRRVDIKPPVERFLMARCRS